MHERCVVFDIDDTLYLERDYVRSGFEAIGVWARTWLEISNFSEVCWQEFESGRRSTIFNNALALCGREPTPELIGCLVELYRSHHPRIQMLEDARAAIKQLRGIASLAVLSDGPLAAQSRKADALNVREWASSVVLTEAFGKQFCKPHQRCFTHIADRVPARRYVYVADNPAKDFAGPMALGWTTVRVRREGGLHRDRESETCKPDIELPDCSGLLTALR